MPVSSEEKGKNLVSMKAVFVTDGNWNDKRRRTVRDFMDADKILNAASLQDAIDYFQSQIYYVNSIEDFEFFTIEDKTYEADFWERKN